MPSTVYEREMSVAETLASVNFLNSAYQIFELL